MLRDLKPRILAGKQGVLGLPANVDFRRDVRLSPPSSGQAVSSPPADAPDPGIPAGRRRSILPWVVFNAVAWALILWMAS